MQNQLDSTWLSEKGYFPLAVAAGSKHPQYWKGGGTDPDWTPGTFKSPCLSIRRDGLIPVDCDVTIPDLAEEVLRRVIAFVRKPGPIRRRANSPKWTMLFRCLELEENQRSLQTGAWKDGAGKTIACVELKGGWSYQTLTHGVHPSGAELIWTPGGADPRGMVDKEHLPLISIGEAVTLRDGLHEIIEERMGRPADRAGTNRRDMEDRYELKDDMVFTDVEGDPWTVAELKEMGRDSYIMCNLDGVRPTSDSGAGIARIGDSGELVITDLVTDIRWRPAQIQETPEELAQLRAGARELARRKGVADLTPSRSTYVHLAEPNKYLRRSNTKNTLFSAAALREAHGKDAALEIHVEAERAEDMAWDPTEAPRAVFTEGDDSTYFNTFWTPPARFGGQMRPFLDFVDALCGEWTPWVHAWIAHKVQKPWLKGITVALVGRQGDGKSTFWRLLSRLVGEHQVSSSATMQGALEGTYHDYKYRTLYAFFHEVYGSNAQTFREKQGVAANYKDICDTMGEPLAQLNIKGKAQERAPVMCTVGIATNYPDALPLEKDDRRTFVLEVQKVPTALVADACDAMGVNPETRKTAKVKGNVYAVHQHYMHYDIEGFDWQHPPMTEAKRRMMEGNVSVGGTYCEDFLAAVEAAGGCFAWDQAKAFAASHGLDRGELAAFKAELKSKTLRRTSNGYRFWYLNTLEEAPRPKEAQERVARLAQNLAAGDLKTTAVKLELIPPLED